MTTVTPLPLNDRPHILYGRVSTEDQAEAGNLETQQYALREFGRRNDLHIQAEFWEDVSGRVALAKRPQGPALLDFVRSHRGVVILVQKVDRLGRSLKAILEGIEMLEDLGATVRSATEQWDPATPQGRFMLATFANLAELDRATTLTRLVEGRDRQIRAARWLQGPVPFGYTLDEHSLLIPSTTVVPELGMSEADAARDIFDRVARGSSAVAEARRLTALGVSTMHRYAGANAQPVARGASGEWRSSRLTKMLHNPLYRGLHVFNAKNGPITREVPALVDEQTWNLVQDRLTSNKRLSIGPAKRVYLLRGLIKCGLCGMGFAGTTAHQHRRGQTTYYRCNGVLSVVTTLAAARCRSKSIRADELEDFVWQDIKAFAINPEQTLAQAQQHLRTRLSQVASLDDETGSLQRALSGKGAERDRLHVLFRRGLIEIDEIEAQLEAIRKESAEIEARLAQLRDEHALAAAYESKVAAAARLLRDLQARIDEVEQTDDRERKQSIINALVARIVVTTVNDSQIVRGKPAASFDVEVTYHFGQRSAVDTTIFPTGVIDYTDFEVLLSRLVVGFGSPSACAEVAGGAASTSKPMNLSSALAARSVSSR